MDGNGTLLHHTAAWRVRFMVHGLSFGLGCTTHRVFPAAPLGLHLAKGFSLEGLRLFIAASDWHPILAEV